MQGTGRPRHLPVFLFNDRWPPVPISERERVMEIEKQKKWMQEQSAARRKKVEDEG